LPFNALSLRIQVLSAFALLLMIGARVPADLVISVDFYEVGTTTPITEPLMVGEAFDMALSVQDTVGTGVSAVLFDWFFDAALLDQGANVQLDGIWTNIGNTGTNATGGTLEVFTFTPPMPLDDVVEVARIETMATAAGTAEFTTAGTGNPLAATFVTFDNRGFFPDGTCVPTSPTSCSGEIVQFGTGSVTIEQELAGGDFNGDGSYDCLDIDALVAEIAAGTNSALLDLTGDGAVDGDDLDAWLVEGGANNPMATGGNPFLKGDANLDGFVDGLDFIDWNAGKFMAIPEWCAGDFNADGFVDGLDFIIWNEHKFMSSDSATPVPEPASVPMLIAGLMLCEALISRLSVS
jgi:hypothetical protein